MTPSSLHTKLLSQMVVCIEHNYVYILRTSKLVASCLCTNRGRNTIIFTYYARGSLAVVYSYAKFGQEYAFIYRLQLSNGKTLCEHILDGKLLNGTATVEPPRKTQAYSLPEAGLRLECANEAKQCQSSEEPLIITWERHNASLGWLYTHSNSSSRGITPS
eukprot:6198809-Pleurochrysis_carterae.AAC.2